MDKKRSTLQKMIVLLFIFTWNLTVFAQDGPGTLHALSAVLMDGDTGRVLYGKEEDAARAMASTTKVMTCLLAIENVDGEVAVEISKNAASQPEVRMDTRAGEHYHMQDLLVAMMLKSYNDTAVAVAEHVGGSVEGFAALMNEKAKKMGCENTNFVTPNGLDATDSEGRAHSTTARDLAKIMLYAIRNPVFVSLTRIREYSFSNIENTRSFYVQNANAYLDMREGVISGKTGYTSEAGYCYVCAYENQERTYIVALLGCGWPSNKSYKWQDMDRLLDYGEENFQFTSFLKDVSFQPVLVEDGIPQNGNLNEGAFVTPVCPGAEEGEDRQVLMREGEQVQIHQTMEEGLVAPLRRGQKIGKIWYTLDEITIASFDLLAQETVEKVNVKWCTGEVFRRFFHN